MKVIVRAGAALGAVLGAFLSLLAPALWNGFPLLQYDTGGYLALMPALVLFGRRRPAFSDIGRLAATLSVAILGNAVACGALSNAHDRYGARLAWVPLLVAALAVLRWQSVAAGAPTQARVAQPAAAAPV